MDGKTPTSNYQDIKNAARAALAGTLGLWAGLQFSELTKRPDNLISGLWCALTSVIVLQSLLGSTYRAAWHRFFGVVIGSFFGGFFTVYFGSDPISVGVAVFCTVLISSLLGLEESYRIAAVSTIVVMVLWGLRHTVSPWTFAWFRFLDSTLGIVIGMFVAHTVWPFRATKKMRQDMASTMRQMGHLFEMVVENKDKQLIKSELKEIDSKLYHNRLTLEESKPEFIVSAEKLDYFTSIINTMDSISESIISLNQVYKESLRVAFDPELGKQLNIAIAQTLDGFEKIAEMLEDPEKISPLTHLENVQYHLKLDLARFRATRATRKYDIEDVEGFFVFFFSLKSILEAMLKIERKTRALKS